MKTTIFVTLLCCTALSAAAASHPDDWEAAGRAVYYEDLMTNNADIKPGHCWVVEMERSASRPGWWRMQPYARMDNYVTRLLEETDMTYIYINATDPQRVWVEEFEVFPDHFEYKFRNLVPENGWNGDAHYGTLSDDDVISFEPLSFAEYDESYDMWHPMSRTTGFRLELGRDEARDVAVRAIPSVCNNDGYIFVKADAGHDVWDIKGYVQYGECTEDMAATAARDGFILNSGETYQWQASRRGLHTFMAVGVDRQGHVLSADYNYAYNNVEPEDDWYDIADEMMEELFVYQMVNTPPVPYAVRMQRHISRPGYFRVIDPYANHPIISYPIYMADHAHSHYIYIDATDTERVVMEASPVGVEYFGRGDLWVSSRPGLESEAGEADSLYGRVDVEGWLTFPPQSLVMLCKNDCSAGWQDVPAGFRLHLPVKGGGVEPTTWNAGPTQRYNLQGLPVGEDAAHGIFIERRADGKVRKIAR